MKIDGRLLRRLTALAATVLMALPTGPGLPTEPEPHCPPGSDVGIDDYVAWLDGTGGPNTDIPLRAMLACGYTRTITFRTYDISAKAGTDYVGVNSGTVTLTGGGTYTTVQIRVLAKPVPGPDVTFKVKLTSGARFSDS